MAHNRTLCDDLKQLLQTGLALRPIIADAPSPPA
jgi:hypothetical protein